MMGVKRWLFLVASLCLCAGVARGQFDDNFGTDPIFDWVLGGNAAWIPPPEVATECRDGTGNADPTHNMPARCTVYTEDTLADLGEEPEDFGGYILATPGLNNQAGSAFRKEKDTYDNFRLETVIEIRDGTALGRPADGMAVVVVGTDNAPVAPGNLGGGMGAPCVGDPDTAPIMVFEFDIWSGNVGDLNNDNHVGFAYGPQGITCTDAVPHADDPVLGIIGLHVPITPRMHNLEATFDRDGDGFLDHVDPNRFKMTVFVQNCGGVATVACDLEAIDQGIDLGRVYTKVIPDFVPFEGFLGVTGSTGAANAAHILHSAKLEVLPAEFCLQPAANGQRAVEGRSPDEVCGDFLPGDDLDVTITLTDVRQDDDCCSAAEAVTVRDTPPAGWTDVSGITDGGSFDGTTVTWVVTGAALAEGKELSYTVTAEDDGVDVVNWGGGSVTENVAGSPPVLITGKTTVLLDNPFGPCGGIKCWNLLGAIMQAGGAGPGVGAVQQDYLTDGFTTELDFVFEPGATITPEFFGASAGQGIFDDPNNVNPGILDGELQVIGWNDPDTNGWINLNDDVYGGDPNNVMAYAQAYVIAEEDMQLFLETSSDDAIQVIINEEEVHLFPDPRGAGVSDCAAQQDVGIPVELLEGENRLIVKIFEGGGGWNFTLRFVDDLGSPVTDGLEISKLPAAGCRVPPMRVARTVDASETVMIGSTSYKAWSEVGASLDVTLDISAIREAAGECTAPTAVTVRETVPLDWTPSGATNGGSVAGNVVTWNLTAPFPAALSYAVEAGGDPVDVDFAGSIEESGSEFRFRVGGDRTLIFVPPALPRGDADVVIEDDFDEHTAEAECPDGWVCNGSSGGFVQFNPGVTQIAGHEGRLRLACGDQALATCGNGAFTVIWDEIVPLGGKSFVAEFDAFLSHPGATVAPADPADGLTFMILDADDFLISPTSIGAAGGSLGYAGLNGFAVELDLWDNDGAGGALDPSGYNVPASRFGHLGVIRDGVVTPHVQTHVDLDPNMIPTSFGGDGFPLFVDFADIGAGDGIPLHVEVDYNNGRLQVFLSAPATDGGLEPPFERTKVIDTVVLFPGAVDLGAEYPVLQNVYFGFSAGTGGAMATHEVDDLTVTVYDAGPAEICDNGVDDNGNTLVDCADPQCVTAPNCVEICDNDEDDDGDTLVDCADPECALAPNCVGGGFDRGDSNADGSRNITDGVFIFSFLFTGGPPPPCMDAGDTSDQGSINITSGIYILNFLFLGGPEPPTPFGECGDDPTPDNLGCESFPPCEP